MMKPTLIFLLFLKILCSNQPLSTIPVSTYSIVAYDPKTGQLGVAVQSHWFSVGFLVPWAKAGVGAVATQSFVKVEYGPDGLGLMEQGLTSDQALEALLKEDKAKDVRQVAMVDINGNVAVHTGTKCIYAAGHYVGKNYSVQDFVERTFNLLGLDWKNHVNVDETLYRPTEVQTLLGDPTKAINELGWNPSKTSFDQLIKMMVDSDLKLVGEKKFINDEYNYKSINEFPHFKE